MVIKDGEADTMSDAKCKGWCAGGFVENYCRKDLKTDEQVEAKLCGRHLAGRRRREANDKARDKKQTLSGELRVKAEVVVARLAKLGVKAAPHYSTHSTAYTGRVMIEDGEALADLLEESS